MGKTKTNNAAREALQITTLSLSPKMPNCQYQSVVQYQYKSTFAISQRSNTLCLGSSAALKASYMISAVHRKISEALSSFTFTKQPKLLKRPSPDISSQPDDPTRSPPEASMPYSRSSKSSNTSTKRPSGGKATEFLNENFGAGGEEDDPIEVQSLDSQIHRGRLGAVCESGY